MRYPGLSLEGRAALVTGAARGIGTALALGLAQAGADVAVSDIPDRVSQAQEVQREIEGMGRSSGTYALDVRDVASIPAVMERVVAGLGRLDGLVNNAGVRIFKPALDFTGEEWDYILDTNLKGLFFCCQAAAGHMVQQGGGTIINVASQMAVVGEPGRAAYCASKAGVVNLTRALALEWVQYGIRVNAIGPGPVLTPGLVEMEGRAPEEIAESRGKLVPLGRVIEAEELVGAAVYLASDAASATNGHLLLVDGGWTAR